MDTDRSASSPSTTSEPEIKSDATETQDNSSMGDTDRSLHRTSDGDPGHDEAAAFEISPQVFIFCHSRDSYIIAD